METISYFHSSRIWYFTQRKLFLYLTHQICYCSLQKADVTFSGNSTTITAYTAANIGTWCVSRWLKTLLISALSGICALVGVWLNILKRMSSSSNTFCNALGISAMEKWVHQLYMHRSSRQWIERPHSGKTNVFWGCLHTKLKNNNNNNSVIYQRQYL